MLLRGTLEALSMHSLSHCSDYGTTTAMHNSSTLYSVAKYKYPFHKYEHIISYIILLAPFYRENEQNGVKDG
jgi:hypothetical protein